MRHLTAHQVNPANKQLTVVVVDEPGSGGANHHYEISGFNTHRNPSDPFTQRHGEPATHSTVLFQNGPIGEAGINGVTHEALLAILIDRMEGFQRGPYASAHNAQALASLREALGWLEARTREREGRGVEGTHTP